MNQQVRAFPVSHDPSRAHAARRKRSAWRQRLVQAERGFVRGVRASSVFYVHFFIVCIIAAAAFVLGVDARQWLTVTICLTLVLAAEMLNQALQTMVHDPERPATAAGRRAAAMGTAAVMVAAVGAGISLAVVFAQRLHALFGG